MALCSLLVLASCASNSSSAPAGLLASARTQGLVDVLQVVPGIEVDLRYRTAENVTTQRLYPADMPCLLHHTTAAKLRIAQEKLKAQGYGLKLWDAWRPPEVQLSLHQHGGYTGMFTDPAIMWSRHCSGTAVDVTLVDSRGRELKMPTGYDEGGPNSHYAAPFPGEIGNHRAILQMAMTAAGFTILDTEWWHFDDGAYNIGGPEPVPPVVYANQIGLKLPRIIPPKVVRKYVYPSGYDPATAPSQAISTPASQTSTPDSQP